VVFRRRDGALGNAAFERPQRSHPIDGVSKVPHDFIPTGHLPAISDAQPSGDSCEAPRLRWRTAQGRPRTGACSELLREIKSQRGGDRRLTELTLLLVGYMRLSSQGFPNTSARPHGASPTCRKAGHSECGSAATTYVGAHHREGCREKSAPCKRRICRDA
jgi:hypothetical protein